MTRGAFSGSSFAIVLIGVAVFVTAGPVQDLQSGPSSLQREEYGSPPLAGYMARYREDYSGHSVAKRTLDPIGGGNLVRNVDERFGHPLEDDGRSIGSPDLIGAGPRNLNGLGGNHLLRQTRRRLDSLSGSTFGESKRFAPYRRLAGPMNGRSGNFDEIDRTAFDTFPRRNGMDEIDTAFDGFFKRNFDEIDRVGWSGFVKRLDNYLANRQQR